MKFNINHCVKVKLTEHGKEHLRKKHEELVASLPNGSSFLGDFGLPKEDEEGYSEWQLWKLMAEFGEIMQHGFNLPFETTIIINTKSDR